MVKFGELPSFKDPRGTLTVIEKVLPFSIQRVYYIYDTNELPRGGHQHHIGQQALICLHKTCVVEVKTDHFHQDFSLCHPHQYLLLEPHEWHSIKFDPGAILLVLASTHYNPKNYIHA